MQQNGLNQDYTIIIYDSLMTDSDTIIDVFLTSIAKL